MNITKIPDDNYVAAANSVELEFTNANIIANTGVVATLDITPDHLANVQVGSVITINESVTGKFAAVEDFDNNEMAISLQSIADWINSNFELERSIASAVVATNLTITGLYPDNVLSVKISNLSIDGNILLTSFPTPLGIKTDYQIVGSIRVETDEPLFEVGTFEITPFIVLNASQTDIESYELKHDISRLLKPELSTPIPELTGYEFRFISTMTRKFIINYAEGFGVPFSAAKKQTKFEFNAFVGGYRDQNFRLNRFFTGGKEFIIVENQTQIVARDQYNWIYGFSDVGNNCELMITFYDNTGDRIDFGSTTQPLQGYNIQTIVSTGKIFEVGVGLIQLEPYVATLTGVTDAAAELNKVSYYEIEVQVNNLSMQEIRCDVKKECVAQFIFLNTFGTYESIAANPVVQKRFETQRETIDLRGTSSDNIIDRSEEILNAEQSAIFTFYLKDWYTDDKLDEFYKSTDVNFLFNGFLVRVKPITTSVEYYNSVKDTPLKYEISIQSPLAARQPASTKNQNPGTLPGFTGP